MLAFFDLRIDKEPIFCLNSAKYYKMFTSKHKISYPNPIRLGNYIVIDKAIPHLKYEELYQQMITRIAE